MCDWFDFNTQFDETVCQDPWIQAFGPRRGEQLMVRLAPSYRSGMNVTTFQSEVFSGKEQAGRSKFEVQDIFGVILVQEY